MLLFFYSTNNKKNVIIITIDGVDNMREAYFEQEEKRIQEKIDLARLGMFAALEFIEFKEKNTERAKRNIEVIISKMIAAPDYQGKQNKRSLLVKKLKDERKTTSLVSLSKVMDRVEKMVESRYRIHWAEAESYSASSQHHDALFKISTSISGNPVDALIEYSSTAGPAAGGPPGGGRGAAHGDAQPLCRAGGHGAGGRLLLRRPHLQQSENPDEIRPSPRSRLPEAVSGYGGGAGVFPRPGRVHQPAGA